ncbi:hypothetical protein B0H19DRAFT_1276426 [Mycena capillaripes]|nr:hypothetical protein B0H19DRAFT_1276426 [Mycena capillaripes]
MATSGGCHSWSISPRFAATPLPAYNGYAGLIRVLLAILPALSVSMRGPPAEPRGLSPPEDDAAR